MENIHHKLRVYELLDESWELASKKFWRLLGLYLMTTFIAVWVMFLYLLPSVVFLGLVSLLHIPMVLTVVGGVLFLGLFIMMTWVCSWQVAALLNSLRADESQTVSTLVREARPVAKRIFPTVLVGSLAVLGGYVIFIIPGIILSISLGLVTVVAVLENKTMWDALARSRDLVRGRWWNIFWVLLCLSVFILLATLVTGGQYSPIVLMITPFVYAFHYLAYKKLAGFKKATPSVTSSFWHYKTAAVIGAVTIVVSIIGGSIAVGLNWDRIRESFKTTPAPSHQGIGVQNLAR